MGYIPQLVSTSLPQLSTYSQPYISRFNLQQHLIHTECFSNLSKSYTCLRNLVEITNTQKHPYIKMTATTGMVMVHKPHDENDWDWLLNHP